MAPAPLDEPDLFDEPTDDELMTPWESDFMASIALWDGDLTDAKQAKLDEIEESLPRRRELWREGRFPKFLR